jgi:hypothetical protein
MQSPQSGGNPFDQSHTKPTAQQTHDPMHPPLPVNYTDYHGDPYIQEQAEYKQILAQ